MSEEDVRGGGENVMLIEVSESYRWGHIPYMGRYRNVDKMTFAVPSVASKSHYPGKDRIHPNSKESLLCKEKVLWLL